MGRIEEKFQQLKKEGRGALIPYFMAGYPTLKTSQKIVEAVAEAGADLIEIGLPFSDPLADGTTIQKAGEIALSQGTTTDKVFQMVKLLRKRVKIPLVLMTYANLIYKYGLKDFAKKAAAAGVNGVILADLPPEEAQGWRGEAKVQGLDTIFLVAPTSTEDRIKKVAAFSEGFIYGVSLTGVTGAREKLPSDLTQFIARVKAKTKKPLAVGFGISSVLQARKVAKIADGVIIGSALLDFISGGKNEKEKIKKVVGFVKEVLKAGVGYGRI